MSITKFKLDNKIEVELEIFRNWKVGQKQYILTKFKSDLKIGLSF